MAGDVGKAYAKVGMRADTEVDLKEKASIVEKLMLRMRQSRDACFERCSMRYRGGPDSARCYALCKQEAEKEIQFINLIKKHMESNGQ